MGRLQRRWVGSTVFALLLVAAGARVQASTLPMNSMDGLDIRGISEAGADPVRIQAEVAGYRERRAVRIVNIEGQGVQTGEEVLAIVKKSDFTDGTIEAEIAGIPRQGAKPSTRGFVGIAFHVQDHGSRYEAFYLRMTNGRADDQVQRNHSAQYMSHPEFSWKRLRDENPGKYESYVDLVAGAWTRIKIVVSGNKARLYVNGADQPCLIVNDLKLGDARGQVALWTGSDTEAYFSSLTIR
jgi:3-keto-disaccharide hydrolase